MHPLTADLNVLKAVAFSVLDEFGNKHKKHWSMSASAKLNRIESGKRVELPDSPPQLKTKEDEEKFKEILSITSALIRGTMERGKYDNYFSKGDMTKKKKENAKYFDGKQSVGKIGRYETFRDSPPEGQMAKLGVPNV